MITKSSPAHINWIVDTGERINTADKKEVIVLELRHSGETKILSAWAKHFRDHYCSDSDIDYYRKGYGFSRQEYLNEIKLPDRSDPLGPSIRAGDFGEVLVSDYLEYILKYWVPRTKYSDKTIRNESKKGSDIIGFKFIDGDRESPEDILIIFESKTLFSGKDRDSLLQKTIDHSAKDQLRKAESLNAIKQRLHETGQEDDANKIDRFQDKIDRPYKEFSGAAALFTSSLLDCNLIQQSLAEGHWNKDNLILVVIKGENMMDLVHELYRRVADEA